MAGTSTSPCRRNQKADRGPFVLLPGPLGLLTARQWILSFLMSVSSAVPDKRICFLSEPGSSSVSLSSPQPGSRGHMPKPGAGSSSPPLHRESVISLLLSFFLSRSLTLSLTHSRSLVSSPSLSLSCISLTRSSSLSLSVLSRVGDSGRDRSEQR